MLEIYILTTDTCEGQRWLRAGYELHGYPALALEAETLATLAAAPPERAGRR
jgi:hypothetical protein